MPRLTSRRSLKWRRPLRLPSFPIIGRLRPRHHHARTGGSKRLSSLFLAIFLTVAAFIGIVAWIEAHIRPLIMQVAEARVYYLASTAINESIGRRLVKDSIQYESLVRFEKDAQGGIAALKTDMLAVNRLKAGVAGDILETLRHMDPSDLGIPLGNIIGGDLFAGRGPEITLRIVPLGTVSAEFSNRFVSAGINQTRHQIMLDITAEMSVLLIGSSCTQTVRVQMCIAETVIVGAVPDSYLSFDPTEDARGM